MLTLRVSKLVPVGTSLSSVLTSKTQSQPITRLIQPCRASIPIGQTLPNRHSSPRALIRRGFSGQRAEPTESVQTVAPALYLVGTPIGNLADLSPRVRHILATVDVVFAEDTRHTAKLLSHCGIHTTLRSLNSQTEAAKSDQVLQYLRQRQPVALVSDAGMPGVSDPGALLAAAAAADGHAVVPIPGPSACLAALVASGLHISAFTFVGFLPAKSGARQARLASLAGRPEALVLFVPARSVAATVAEASEAMGADRRAVIARELTKVHEEFIRGTLDELACKLVEQPLKGEVTMVIEGAREPESSSGEAAGLSGQEKEFVHDLAAEGVSAKSIARLGSTYQASNKNAFYAYAVQHVAQQRE